MDGHDSGPLTDSPKKMKGQLTHRPDLAFSSQAGLHSPWETATQVTFTEKHIKVRMSL